MSLRTSAAAMLALLFPVFAWSQADAEEEAPKSPWSGEIAFGYIASSGNTDTSSSAGRLKVAYDKGAWENFVEFKVFASSDDNEDDQGEKSGTTAETYEAIGRSLYNFNEKNYGYGQLEWRKNRFSAYTEQWFETAGYGHRLLTGDVFMLNLEAGIGLTQQDKVVDLPAPPGATGTDTERNVVYSAGGEFIWQISETAKFEQLANAKIASDNTAWETVSRIKLTIVEKLALSVGYTIQGNTDVSADVEKTDRYTAITLDYAF